MFDKQVLSVSYPFALDDADSRKADLYLDSVEKIDDDCDVKGISLVKVNENNAGEKFGINNLPKLVYFKNEIPSVYDGNLFEKFFILIFDNAAIFNVNFGFNLANCSHSF